MTVHPNDQAPEGSPEPLLTAGFRELIHGVHHVPTDEGGFWTWRCGVVYSRCDPGWVDGACRYDHTVHGSHAQMVGEAVQHLHRWHDIRLAAPADRVETAQVRVWHLDRFGDGDPRGYGCKLAEETGEVTGALLKRHEGAVRLEKGLVTRDDWTRHLHDEIGDVGIALHALCGHEGVDLDTVIANRWHGDVSQRGARTAATETSQ